MWYTVIGVWLNDEPIPVGVIQGRHTVNGGDQGAFPEGLWATSVQADSVQNAADLAVSDMY